MLSASKTLMPSGVGFEMLFNKTENEISFSFETLLKKRPTRHPFQTHLLGTAVDDTRAKITNGAICLRGDPDIADSPKVQHATDSMNPGLPVGEDAAGPVCLASLCRKVVSNDLTEVVVVLAVVVI